MALTVTLLTSQYTSWDNPANNVSTTIPVTTASVTPGTNCQLVMMLSAICSGTSQLTSTAPVSSGSGPAWTLVEKTNASAGYNGCSGIWTAAIGGSSPGSFTVSASFVNASTSDFSIYLISVLKITGHDTGTPTGGKETTQGNAGNGNVDITLDAAPGSSDVVLAQCLVDENSASRFSTFGTGTWTTLEDGSASTHQLAYNIGYRSSSTSTTVNWSDVNSGPDSNASTQAAVVVKVAAGGGGDATATPAVISTPFLLPAATVVGDLLPVVATSAVAALTTSASPSVTFAGWTPALNDVVILFPSSTAILAIQATGSMPSGWVNPLGSGVSVNSDSHGICVAYHLVTSGEVSGVTLTYTATSLLTATHTGRVHGVVVRYADPTTPIDGSGTTFDSSNTVTPHVLASITGSGVLLDNSLVVSSVAADGTGTYGSIPSGWTQLQTAGTTQGRWTGTRNAYTVVNTNVTATNITPSAGDEYASITLAVAKAPSGNATATPAQIVTAAVMPAPTPQAGTVKSPAVTSVAVAVPAVTVGGSASASPAVISSPAVLPAPTPKAGTTVTAPAVISSPFTIPAATATSGGGGGAAAVVQFKAATGATSVTFNSSTTTGNKIIVAVWKYASTIGTTDVTDNKSNTYTRRSVNNSVSGETAIFESQDSPTMGATHQISLTAGTDNGLCAYEVSGLTTTPFDKEANTAGGGSTASLAPGPTATLTQADEWVMAVTCSDQMTNAAITENAGQGWTLAAEEENGSSFLCFNTVYKTVSSTSAITATWAYSGGANVLGVSGCVATFKATTAGSPTATPAVISTAAVLPAVTATGSGNGTAAPAVTAAAIALPAVNVTGGGPGTAHPSVIPIELEFPGAAVMDQTAAPAVTTVTVTMPAPTLQAGSTKSPAVITTAVTLPAPTPQAGGSRTPAVTTVTVNMPAAATSGGTTGTASPAAIPVTITLPQASASGTNPGTVTPAAITTTVALPAVTPLFGWAATPAPITVAFTPPAVQAGGSETVTPAVVPVAVTVPQASATGTTPGVATPNVTAVVTVIPTPGIVSGYRVNPATINLAITALAVLAYNQPPDTNPITVTVADTGYTVTVRAVGNTASIRERP